MPKCTLVPRFASIQDMKTNTIPHTFARLVAVVAAALLALAPVALTGCSNSSVPNTPAYVSPYDWSGLTYTGNRLTYSEGGQVRSQLGIDVSDHQGTIDWQAVANDGIDFAIVRAGNRGYTEGALYADTQFSANIDGTTAAGLDVGAYFFSQATTAEEAREEANLVLQLLGGRYLALPVVFDHEPVSDAAGRANSVTGDTLNACAQAFCERLEAGGYETMIYGNKQDIARFGSASSVLANHDVWFAEYGVAQPSGQFDFTMWQYSNGGTVAGIGTAVDMNIKFLAN